jgi:hypothetical protein
MHYVDFSYVLVSKEFILSEEEASGSFPLQNQCRAETALSFEPSAITLPTLAGHGNDWCFILSLLHWGYGRLTKLLVVPVL